MNSICAVLPYNQTIRKCAVGFLVHKMPTVVNTVLFKVLEQVENEKKEKEIRTSNAI